MIKIPVYTSSDTSALKNIYSAYFRMLNGVLPFNSEVIKSAQKVICDDLGLSDLKTIEIAAASKGNQKCAMRVLKKHAPDIHTYLCGNSEDDSEIKPEKLAALLDYLPGRGLERERALDQIKSINNKNDRDALKSIFSYKLLTLTEKSEYVYQLAEALGSKVCPYCNRAFTNTIKTKKNKNITRPELDHLKPKSLYPFFAVSLRNLIPCCHVCNHVKRTAEGHLNPYLEGVGNDCYFEITSNNLGYLHGELESGEQVSVECIVKDSVDAKRKERIEQSRKVFAWEEQYNLNKDLALRVFRQRYIFNDACLDMMLKGNEALFSNKEYLRSLLFLRSVEESEWGDYPLSKFIHDLNAQYDRLAKSEPK